MSAAHQTGYWLQQFLNAGQLASFYVPLAIAFMLIQAISRRVFLSFGDFTMFASFAAVYSCLAMLLQGHTSVLILMTSLLLSMACAGALAYPTAVFVFQPLLMRSNQAFMIGCIGLSLVLQEMMRIQSSNKDQWLPPIVPNIGVELIGGTFTVRFTLMSAMVIAVSGLAVGLTYYILKYTRFGRHWLAVCDSEKLANLCGLDTAMIFRNTCMFSAGLAAVSGWILAVSYGGANYNMGLMLGFKAMFASVIGGFGTLKGAVFGGVALAALEVLWQAFFPLAYRDVGVFAFIIFILILRPEGLAGLASRRESEA
jgi:branched-chain amino acid transport system permease protein